MSLTDGVDNELRSCIDIASDKDARIACLIGEGICHRIIAVMEGDVCTLEQFAPLDGLTDRKYHSVSRDDDCVVLIIFRREFSGRLVDRGEAAFQNDGCYLAVIIREDLLGTPARIDDYIFILRLFDLFGGCGHCLA